MAQRYDEGITGETRWITSGYGQFSLYRNWRKRDFQKNEINFGVVSEHLKFKKQ